MTTEAEFQAAFEAAQDSDPSASSEEIVAKLPRAILEYLAVKAWKNVEAYELEKFLRIKFGHAAIDEAIQARQVRH